MRKKIILIILFLVTIVLMIFVIYKIFFQTNRVGILEEQQPINQGGSLPQLGEGTQNVQEGSGLISADGTTQGQTQIKETEIDEFAQGGFTKVKEDIAETIRSQSFSNTNNGMAYYSPGQQSFFRISESGEITKLSDKKFYSVENVTWSDKNNRAIIEYPDGTKILYDFNKDRSLATFPKDMKEFAFSASEDKIASKWVGPYEDYNYIVGAGYDGSNLKFVEPMGMQERNVQIVWSPDNEIMATYRKYIDSERQEIFFINENGKNLTSLIVEGGNFKGTWNPSGEKLLYSVYNSGSNYNPTLWVANGKSDQLGGGKKYLGINTWVDKCDFANTNSQYVYCAVPENLPKGSGMNPSIANSALYSIYKVDINEGRLEKIAQPINNGAGVSINKIYLNNQDSKIYYTDQFNNHLYSIELK